MDGRPSDPPELTKALLSWVQAFDFSTSVTSFRDLQDGGVVWKILQEVDPEYFAGELPEPEASKDENWIPRWQNLKHIDKYVTAFIRDEMGKLPELSKQLSTDLKAIAIDASSEDSLQLLKFCFLAAIYSPKSNQRMIMMLGKLGNSAQRPIADSIKNMEAWDQRLAEVASQGPGSDPGGMLSPERTGPSPEPGFHRDVELEWEERLIEANSTIRNQQEKVQNLHRLLEQYRTQTTELEGEINELKYQRDQGGASNANSEAVDQMRKKAAEDRDYIAELESEMNTLRGTQEDMESQLRRYRNDADSKQKLRDELQMVKVERDDLVQKTKANDNLRKKIQNLQEADKSNSTLREEIESLQEELRSTRGLREKFAALQKQNEERSKTIANGEQEIFDMRTTRRRLDQDLKFYQQRYEQTKERHQRDADIIAELEEKVRELEAGQGKTSQEVDTLDAEFASSDKTHTELWTRIGELEKENASLKQAQGSAVLGDDIEVEVKGEGESAMKQQMELLQQRYHRIEKQYLDTFQENLGLDAALKEADPNVLESRPFIEMRDRLQTTADDLEQAKKRLFDVEGELSEKVSSLEAAEGRLAAMDEDKIASAGRVQKSANAQNEVLQKENDRLTSRVESLQIQFEDKSSLLRHALTDQERLLKEDEELRNGHEARLIQEQLSMHKTKGEPSEDELVLSLAERIEISRRKAREVEEKASQVSTVPYFGAHHHQSNHAVRASSWQKADAKPSEPWSVYSWALNTLATPSDTVMAEATNNTNAGLKPLSLVDSLLKERGKSLVQNARDKNEYSSFSGLLKPKTLAAAKPLELRGHAPLARPFIRNIVLPQSSGQPQQLAEFEPPQAPTSPSKHWWMHADSPSHNVAITARYDHAYTEVPLTPPPLASVAVA